MHANMMLLQCKFLYAHLIGVLDLLNNNTEHGNIGTASLGTPNARGQAGNG